MGVDLKTLAKSLKVHETTLHRNFAVNKATLPVTLSLIQLVRRHASGLTLDFAELQEIAALNQNHERGTWRGVAEKVRDVCRPVD